MDEAETVFIEYKLIVKELLFNGANRNIKNAQGKTAFEIIYDYQDTLSPNQLRSLSFILQDNTTCMCCMRHRPIKKVHRSWYIVMLGIFINLVIAYLFYYQLDVLFKEPTFLITTHYVLAYSSALCFMVVIPSFIMSVTLVPGYLEKKIRFYRVGDGTNG